MKETGIFGRETKLGLHIFTFRCPIKNIKKQYSIADVQSKV
jgi:hypothetical protein